jgi:NADPH:quinone reductase-like Zn-dependent oxidoreductase
VIGKGEMRMKKFSVCVSTTFDGYVEVDASSKEEAIEEVWKMFELGIVSPVADFDPFTEIHYAEEIENA